MIISGQDVLFTSRSDFLVEFDTGGQRGVIDDEVVIREAASGGDTRLGGNFYPFEEFVRGSIAERGTVFEDE